MLTTSRCTIVWIKSEQRREIGHTRKGEEYAECEKECMIVALVQPTGRPSRQFVRNDLWVWYIVVRCRK
jgi:hypothetical protein